MRLFGLISPGAFARASLRIGSPERTALTPAQGGLHLRGPTRSPSRPDRRVSPGGQARCRRWRQAITHDLCSPGAASLRGLDHHACGTVTAAAGWPRGLVPHAVSGT